MPAELAPPATTTLTVQTRVDAQPTINVERLDGHIDGLSTWSVSVAGAQRLSEGPLGGEQHSVTVEQLSAQIDSGRLDFGGFRPPWADLSFSPPRAPDQPAPIRRLRRGFVMPTVVFGTDNRQTYFPFSYPWFCVGKVASSNGKVGSGFLVGKRLVITASHMVPWNTSPWWMKFTPGYYNGASALGANIYSFVRQFKGINVGASVCGYDYALLQLWSPLGASYGYFGVNGYLGSWQGQSWWTILGYPGAIAGGERPSWQSQAAIVDDDNDQNGGQELETNGDTSPGNSGGPIFGWWGTDPRAIGGCSGSEFDIGQGMANVFAGGPGLSNLVAWGKQNWDA